MSYALDPLTASLLCSGTRRRPIRASAVWLMTSPRQDPGFLEEECLILVERKAVENRVSGAFIAVERPLRLREPLPEPPSRGKTRHYLRVSTSRCSALNREGVPERL